MKKTLVIVIAVSLLASSAMLETVPLSFSYQGRLTDAAGGTVNGTFDMTFRIYDSAVGGNLLWEEIQIGVVVTNNLLNVVIPFNLIHPAFTPSEPAEPLDLPEPLELWLEVEVEVGLPIMPRTRLYSSPFSVLSYGLAGHIFTSQGHIYMVPGPPVSDCTYVPLEMAVDSSVTRIRMKPYIPVNDCTYVPLELKVDGFSTNMHLAPPNPVTPVDSVEPAINMSVDATMAMLQLFGVDPDPLKSHHRGADIWAEADAVSSSILLQHSGDRNEPTPIAMKMSTGIGSGASLVMFNPQPEPPGTPDPWLSLMASEMGGASLEMFNTESNPGPPTEPTLRLNGGMPDGIGPLMEMFIPPVDPDHPVFSVNVDAAMGASLEMFNTEANPGPLQSPTIQMNGGTDVIDPNCKLMHTTTGPAGEMKSSDVEITVNGNMGSELMLHHTEAVGIVPCMRLFSEGAAAGMSIFATPPPDDGRTSDSAVINLKVDTVNAKIEMFGAAPGTEASIVLVSDNSGGKVGINTDSPAAALDVVGNICVTGTVGACSDERYKKNIETITNALALIEKMRGVNFNWRTDEFADKRFSDAEQVGFIAQELKEVLPELVSQGSDGFYSVDYSRLTPVLVEAVKEQQKEITSLKSEMQELKRLVQALATSNNEIATSR